MKKSELKQLIKETIIAEGLLTETFASSTVKKFFDEIRPLDKYQGKMPYDLRLIQWDKIPEEAVKYTSVSEAIPYMKAGKIIIWITKSQKTLKYGGIEYTRYGGRIDKSRYARPGIVAITVGKEFMYGGPGDPTSRPAQDRYEKPSDLNIKKLTTEIADSALVFLEDPIKYSNVKLRTSRYKAREGATALMNNIDILNTNQNRYRQALKTAKNTKGTAEITAKVNTLIVKLKAKMEEQSHIDFNDLLTFNANTYNKAEQANVKPISFDDLNKTVKIFNLLSSHYVDYINEAMQYGFDHKYAEIQKKYLDDYIEDAEQYLA